MDLIETKDFEKIRDQYLDILENHPDKEELKKKLIVGDDFIFKVNRTFSEDEVSDLSQEDQFYFPICTKKEIKRINNCKTADDYLLKIRAEAIADNVRFERVFLARYEKNKENWSLSSHFDTRPFSSYLKRLSKSHYRKCKDATAGFAFLKEATGKCIYSKYGNIILVSESLSQFLYYMNLAVLELGQTHPHDKFNALMIGIRIMLGSESLDFDLDPRGALPKKLHNSLKYIVKMQLEFVIGHEFAHHILGHGSSNIARTCPISQIIQTRSNKSITYYNYRQKQEFQADWFSIKKAKYAPQERNELVNSVFLFFMHLDLFESINEYLSPGTSSSTHPGSISRIWRLRRKIHKDYGDPPDVLDETIQKHTEFKKFILKEIVPYHVDDIEKYGSMYLPSFKKETLIDRIDY
ncbi:M48 family metalloprotease [Desulfobacterota bacterium M19]